MTTFEYGEIVGGDLVLLPHLKPIVEAVWHHHQKDTSSSLDKAGMVGWRVRLMPFGDGNPSVGHGSIARGIKLIIICLHTNYEMRATLYHEILHYQHPDWNETQIEEQTRTIFPQKDAF